MICATKLRIFVEIIELFSIYELSFHKAIDMTIIDSKFYHFTQTNSGGYFDIDDNVCNHVIIEALSEEQARSLLSSLIVCQSPSCKCCGDRWAIDYPTLVDTDRYQKNGYAVSCFRVGTKSATETRWHKKYGGFTILQSPSWERDEFLGRIKFESIVDYAQFMSDEYSSSTPAVIIHYLNGEKLQVFRQVN